MASVEELIIKLSADNADLKKKLSDSKSDVSGFGGVVGKLAPMIAGAFTVGAVLSFGKAAFTAAEEQTKANKRLELAVKGNAAAFKVLTEQAEKLRSTTAVDDAAIMQIQGLGAAAGYSIARIQKMTEAAVELSSVTGQDLQAAFMQINMTLSGSAGRLTRLDADFGKLTASQLQNGDAIDLVLKKYKGFAAESATATEKLKSNWDEFSESVGVSFATVINPVLEGISEWMNSINRKQGFWQKLATILGGGTTAGMNASFAMDAYNFSTDENIKKQAAARKANKELFESTQANAKKIGEMQDALNAKIGEETRKIYASAEARKAYATAWEEQMKKVHAIDKVAKDNTSSTDITRSELGDKDINKLTPKKIADPKLNSFKLIEAAQARHDRYMTAAERKAAKESVAIEQTKQATMMGLYAYYLDMGASLFKENTIAHKVLASATAAVDTYAAANKALNSDLPVPLNFIAMGVTIAAGIANVAKINGIGFAQGGIVGGSSFSGDSITARVNSGEMILNGSQQAQLFAMANGMGSRQQVEVVGYISGDVIRLANKRSTYMQQRIG